MGNQFQSEMIRARGMQGAQPAAADYWLGYQRGLRRAHHGSRFGTEEEHRTWLLLVDEQYDESRKDRGRGYIDGLLALTFGEHARTALMRELRRTRSDRRAAASRENGKKGGRPPKLDTQGQPG